MMVTGSCVRGIVCKRINWVVHAYCLMSNHYYQVVEATDVTLSAGMRHKDISQPHCRATARRLADVVAEYLDRNTAVAKVHRSGAYSMAEIAEFFGERHSRCE